MRQNTISLARRFLCGVAVLVTMATAAKAEVRIGGWSFFVNGRMTPSFEYTGPCPAALRFDFGVIAAEPSFVTYTYARGDGGHLTGTRSVSVPANHSVPIVIDWTLGANTPAFSDFHSWLRLDIVGPNPVSRQIPFTLHCR